jgi:hypothetical protein
MPEEGNVADPVLIKKLTGREPTVVCIENLDYLGKVWPYVAE